MNIFQGGNIQRQGTTDARFRAADFGPSPLAEGLQKLGQAGAQAAEKIDEIEDVSARIEANRLAVEHSEMTRTIGQRVRQSLGEDADAAAQSGAADLDKFTTDLIGRASPRAAQILDSELRTRAISAKDGWATHGFSQKADALESSSVARIGRVVEDASDLDDEDAAMAMLAEVKDINAKRAQFFGKGADWEKAENAKPISGYHRGKALKIATNLGENGGAHAAIQYVTKNRGSMSEDDYNAIVGAYDGEALKDWAFARAQGYDPTVVGVLAESVAKVDPLSPVPASSVQATPEGKPVVAARADPSVVFANLIIPNEGTTRVMDSNGAWAKFGINEAFNDVDTRNLTQAGAERIFIEKYWKPSGADKLPPGLAAMHADTYYLNPTKAKAILRDSGGDPDRYMELRRGFLGGLNRSNPAKYPNYESRNKRVEAFADRLGDGGALPSIDVKVNMSVESIKDKVFSTPGVGMRAKRAYYEALVDARSGLRQEREERESEAARGLTTAMVQLGDNFTSLTQLPQGLVLQASPSTLSAITTAMRSNRENKPLPLNVQATVAYIGATDPTSFLDPKVQQKLLSQGVTPKQLGGLVQAGAAEQGRRAKPGNKQPLAGSTLLSIARPHLKAAGIDLDSLDESAGDEDKNAKPEERKRDAAKQLQVITYLGERQAEWRSDPKNMGRTPPEEMVRKWTGWAILKTRDGNRAFEASDAEIYTNLNPSVVGRLRRSLWPNGNMPPRDERIRAIVDLHQREVTLSGR